MFEFALPQARAPKKEDAPLAKCLYKNYLSLKKWALKTKTNCFRLYDREISTYPVAIDFYAGKFCVHYFSPKRAPEEPEEQLVAAINLALGLLFDVSAEHIYYRYRAKHKATRQYEKLSDQGQFFEVLEYGARFLVNLRDYLDTGLFLDHRQTRRLVACVASGKRLLNLFAYTCAFSVQAARQGATFTKSVDMSNTYTAWGRENLRLNGFSMHNHPVERADCLKFIDQEIASGVKYDVIVVDPPTISRSKKMDQLFDIQIDYVPFILKALQLLAQEGLLFFSTNARRFNFEPQHFKAYDIEEITAQTHPLDFKDKQMHRCWKFQRLH